MNKPLTLLALTLVSAGVACATEPDPLAPWRDGVRVHPVSPGQNRHSIHTYFNVSPESPDGKWVLFYASTTRDSHQGELRIRSREDGSERVLVSGLNTEDAHRAACQQWVSDGKRAAYHNESNGNWYVAAVDLDGSAPRILARDRLLCWGQANGDLVPIYGKHWAPGAHRDLELLDVNTGAIRTVLKADTVRETYQPAVQKLFGEKEISLFFPELSPDSSRVFFKLSAPGNGDPRSSRASTRQGLVCYDLQKERLLFMREQWGHPAWHPDSRHILDVGYSVLDTDNGKTTRIPDLPPMGSGHPSFSPDGKLIVTDLTMDKLGGKGSDWAVVVCDVRGGSHVVLHQFNNSAGAQSWRRSHPHPVFSPDGRRIYFNVSSGPWTELHAAECATSRKPQP